MRPAAAHHKHAASPVAQHLDRKMRRAAEAVESDRRARLDVGALDCAKPDYAGAQQRRRLFIAERSRQRVREVFAHDGVFAVAAVVVVAGEARIWTKIFAAATAIDADAASLAQPCYPDAIALLEAACADAALVDDAHHFMPRYDSRMMRWQITFGDVKIGAAHSARFHAHSNFALARLGHGGVDRVERIGFDRRGLLDHHRLHRKILYSMRAPLAREKAC